MGFDGGGSKTDCVLMDEAREVLARTRSGPSNPTRVGLETAIATLLRATDKALAASGKSPADINEYLWRNSWRRCERRDSALCAGTAA